MTCSVTLVSLLVRSSSCSTSNLELLVPNNIVLHRNLKLILHQMPASRVSLPSRVGSIHGTFRFDLVIFCNVSMLTGIPVLFPPTAVSLGLGGNLPLPPRMPNPSFLLLINGKSYCFLRKRLIYSFKRSYIESILTVVKTPAAVSHPRQAQSVQSPVIAGWNRQILIPDLQHRYHNYEEIDRRVFQVPASACLLHIAYSPFNVVSNTSI